MTISISEKKNTNEEAREISLKVGERNKTGARVPPGVSIHCDNKGVFCGIL